jgi:hypothetical protein
MDWPALVAIGHQQRACRAPTVQALPEQMEHAWGEIESHVTHRFLSKPLTNLTRAGSDLDHDIPCLDRGKL